MRILYLGRVVLHPLARNAVPVVVLVMFGLLGLALAVLGAEFVWARRLLKKVRAMAESAIENTRGSEGSTNDQDGSGSVTKDLRGGGAEE